MMLSIMLRDRGSRDAQSLPLVCAQMLRNWF